MNNTTSDEILLSDNNTVDVVCGFIWLLITTVIVLCFPIFYQKIRYKFPVTVNCWFCNKNTKVPYEDANCWDCPFCEQYNGFSKDGGYNKIIKEQYFPSLNHNIYNSMIKNPNKKEVRYEKLKSNGLCRLCNINQQLKIQQLACFVPLNENSYDSEVEQFKQQLEKSYSLCFQCKKVLETTLQKQQYNLLKDRLNVQKDKYQFLKLHDHKYLEYKLILPVLRRTLCSGLKLISGITSVIMFFSFISQLETEKNFFKDTLPEIFFLEDQPLLQEILDYLTYSYKMKKEFTSFGLLCYSLSLFCRRGTYDHPSLMLFWGILHTLSWSNMTVLQVLASAMCISLSVTEIQMSPNYALKKLSRNKSEVNQSEEETLTPHTASKRTKTDFSEQMAFQANRRLNETPESPNVVNELKAEESLKEIPVNEFHKLKPKNSPSNKANESFPSQSKSVFSKNFLATLDGGKADKESSPPPEIFHNLSNLHIGNSSGKPGKPSNFLFESHNFEEKFKRTSPVIKSPKFVKPTGNSWVNGELNESFSRSSTPSSGYSSQKPDRMESRQNVFQYPKVVSPVPFNRISPADNFDYWDRNHSCFSPNFQYFPPRYVPLQHFPNPLGHASVYTYTRPADYPFSFPQSANSPDYCYSPVSLSTRYSDESGMTENLFQNASKSYQSNQKWSTIKTFLYNVSIFSNVVSACILIYFTWTGIVSLTEN